MPKSRLEKIADWDEEIAQIKNKQKQERQKYNEEERKARNHRLCKRHAILESMLPEIAGITDEQFKSLIEKAVDNEFFQQLLDGMTAMAKDIAAYDKEQTAQDNADDKAEQTASTAPSQAPNSSTQKPHNNKHNHHNPHHKSNSNGTGQSN